MNTPRVMDDEPSVSDYRRSVADYDAADHEISLGTPTILGLFFALAIVCACFFGLGYALGRRSSPPTPQVFDTTTAAATAAAKPAAGSTAAQQTTDDQTGAAAATDPSTQTQTVPLTAVPTPDAPAAATPAAAAATSAAPVAPAVAPGTFVVQVAAVSSQDVANILVSSLEKKGYAVAVRQETQDKLLHVQIGPFNNRKDAEAMRQRVLADGFNAIVK
ncbi:MAG TPA: SPOR domain-containing protein [Acidobacteriaceae bacterium]|nr:SPOR domain-containing protein [Acidobacteriaceae bacterium]